MAWISIQNIKRKEEQRERGGQQVLEVPWGRLRSLSSQPNMGAESKLDRARVAMAFELQDLNNKGTKKTKVDGDG